MRKNNVPLNQFRKFEVELDVPIFEGLRLLCDTAVFAKDIHETAEVLFCEWVRSQLPESKEKNKLLWQRSEERGYVPVKSGIRIQNPETFSVAYVELGGMPRYFVEQLSRAEPGKNLRNPYYQRTPEKIISMVLIEEVPKRIEEFKQWGLIDEDDLLS